MPEETFDLITVIRTLDGNVELAEALGFPEISALDDSERKWSAALATKAKLTLEDHELAPARLLHRRRVAGPVEIAEFEMEFAAPKRSASWQEPIQLRVQYVRWSEGDLLHAYAPAFAIHVFGTKPEQLPERLEAHIRLITPTRRKQISLQRIALASRFQDLRIGELQISATPKTPKQIALEDDDKPEEKSTLEKVADRIDGDATKAFEIEDEVRQLAEILSGPQARSVLIVGPPGSGKTALVRELAGRKRDFSFARTPFWSTTGARLMTGQLGFGMWQERCQKVCREAGKYKAILHLNHLSELLEVGQASRGDQSVGSFLRPWLARGELMAIAECTPEELGAIERAEPHLAACFQRFTLKERTPKQTRAILRQAFGQAGGEPSDDPNEAEAAVERLRRLHERYATYSATPGRPLRFLRNLLADRFPSKSISETDVIAAFSRETGLPRLLLDDNIPLRLDEARAWFSERIIGQPEAIDGAVDLLAVIKARLARPRKPLASFLFIGPTGAGKTEMAKALAEYLFGDAARLARFDLNEFNDPISVQRLIGGPAIGASEGLLTARVREQPFTMLLLDEFEKADPSFFDLLLQILGDGRLTDASGRVADFCNSVIVMTSNLGAQGFQRGSMGFAGRAGGAEANEHFSDAVRKFLRPEIYNRLDSIVPFRPLTQEIVLAIARRHLDLLRGRDGLRLRDVDLQFDAPVAEHLAKAGYDPRYGARPLKRAIEQQLLAPLANALAPYQRATPLTVRVRAEKGRLVIQTTAARNNPGEAEQKQSDERRARETTELRRRIGKLARSPAAARIDDEIVTLEAMERRALAGKWKTPSLHERLARLPSMRDWQRRMNALTQCIRNLESDVLGILYRNDSPETQLVASELSKLNIERGLVARELVRLQYPRPDEVSLAIFCEQRDTLVEFARAYASFGELAALEYFVQPPGQRSAVTKPIREKPKKLDASLQNAPEKFIGVIMQLRGDLFYPRLIAEAGLHLIGDGKQSRACLIEASDDFANYDAPEGIERSGAVKSRHAPLVRTFVLTRREVDDTKLGTRPWAYGDMHPCVAALSEERLAKEIERLTC